VAIGRASSYSNAIGIRNTAVGEGAYYFNVSGSENVAIGYVSSFIITNGNYNTTIGAYSGQTLKSGSYNTLIGWTTDIATGSFNTIIGASVALTGTTNNNIILADGAGNIKLRYSGSWTYSGSIAGEVRALTITSQTASVDLSTANLFTLALVSGSTTNINPTNLRSGQSSMIKITQPAGGGGSVSFNSAVKFPSGLAYTASIGSNVVDTISFASFDGTTLQAVAAYNFI